MIIPYNNPSASSVLSSLGSSIAMRNRIVNGDMRIDQQNAGASVGVAGGPTSLADKWKFQGTAAAGVVAVQQVTATPPNGFSNYLRITVTTADAAPAAGSVYAIYQPIEGTYCQDLQFGVAANTQSVTNGFWVRSSLTGAFSGSLRNGPVNRSYPFSFTITSANVWQFIAVTIPADTTGTWPTNTSAGIYFTIDFGSGANSRGVASAWAAVNNTGVTGAVSLLATNGATFDLTGVQLEPGTAASAFEQRPLGDMIRLCQRELQKSFLLATAPAQNVGINTAETLMSSTVGTASALGLIAVELPVIMRAAPAIITYNPAAANAQVRDETGAVDCSATASVNATERRIAIGYTTNVATVQGNKLGIHWIADARI